VRLTPVLFCLIFLFNTINNVSARIPDSAASKFIYEVQVLLFNDRFEKADSLCRDFISSDSINPVGYLFRAGALLAEMSDREEAVHSEEIRELIDSSIKLCDSGLEVSIGTAAAFYYLWRGHAHVYRSVFESRFGSFTSAIKHGFRAHDDYRKGLKNDSAVYDLYFGLGNYHYWKSVKAGLLRTIGLVNNDIEKGLNEIHLAVDSGMYFSGAAENSLIWIWLNEKKYDSVIVLANKMLENYPDSRTLRWPLAEAYNKSGNHEKSAELYSFLRHHFANNKGNYFNLIECDYLLYQCYQNLNFKSKADEILESVDKYRIDVPKSTLRGQLAKLNYLRRELAR